MPDLPTNIIIRLVNQVTSPLRQMTNDFAVMKAAGKSAEKAFDWGMKLNQSAEAVRKVSDAVAGMIDGPIELAKQSEVAFVLLQQRANLSGEAFEGMKNQIAELGSGSTFDVAQLTQGVTLLMKRGFDANQAVAELPRVMALAEGQQISLADATQMTATLMRGFGAAATETAHTTDVLTKAASLSGFGIQDVGSVLSGVAPTAKRFGVTMDQTAGLLAAFGKAGFNAEQAGGALSAVFGKLSSPRGARMVTDVLGSIGIKATDASGNLRALPDLLGDVYGKTKDMGALKQGRYFEAIFGSADLAGMMKAAGPAGLGAIIAQIQNSQGAAKSLADSMGGTATEANERYEASLKRLKEALGRPLLAGIASMTNAVAGVVDAITSWSREHPILTAGIMKTLKVVALLTAGVAGLLTTLGALAGGLGLLNLAIGLKGTVSVKLLTTAFSGLGKAMMTLFANPVGLVILGIAALSIAIYLLATHWKQVSGYFEGVWERFSNATLGVKIAIVALIAPFALMLGPLILIGLAANQIVKNWEPIKAFFVSIATAIGGAFDTIAEKMKVVTGNPAWKFLVTNPLAAATAAGQGVATLGGGVADVFTGPSKSEVGGELRIKVDGPASVTDASATGGWNMLIDTGFGMVAP